METDSAVSRVPLTDILALCKAGLSLPDISLCTGVKLRTVQRWVKRYRDNGGEEIANMQVRCGRKGICSPQVLEEFHRQLQINPRVTARQLKDANPALLGGLSLRTIQRWLREDMGVTRNAGWRKYYDLVTPEENMKDIKTKPSGCSPSPLKEEATPQAHLQELPQDDQDNDELFDDDLEVEIKEEVVDDELPETLETLSCDVEPTVETKMSTEIIIPESKPSTSYISVTPLHKVLPTIDKPITLHTRLADMDEFHLFGMNVASQLRALPLHDALQAQLEIQTILAQKRSQILT